MADNTNAIDRWESTTSGGLKLNFHGGIYQIKLLLLVALRGYINGDNFRITTETKEEQGLDDVIYKKTKNGKTVVWYLQAKHIQDENASFLKKDLYDLKQYWNCFYNIVKKQINFAICGIYFFTNGRFENTDSIEESETNNEVLKFQGFSRTPPLPQPMFYSVPECSYHEISSLATYLVNYSMYNYHNSSGNELFEKYFVALIYGKVLRKSSYNEIRFHEAFVNNDNDLKLPVKKMRKELFQEFKNKKNIVVFKELQFEYCYELDTIIKNMNAVRKGQKEADMSDDLLNNFSNQLLTLCNVENRGTVILDFNENNNNFFYLHILVNLFTKPPKVHFRDPKRMYSKHATKIKEIFDKNYSKLVTDKNITEILMNIKLTLAPQFHDFSHDGLNEEEINVFVKAIKHDANIFDCRSPTELSAANKLLGCMFVYTEKSKTTLQVKSSFFESELIEQRNDLKRICDELKNQTDWFKKSFDVLEGTISCYEKHFEIPDLSNLAKSFYKLFKYAVNQPNVDELDNIILSELQTLLNMANVDLIYADIFKKIIAWFKDRNTTPLTRNQFEMYLNDAKQKFALSSFTCLSKDYYFDLEEKYSNETHFHQLNDILTSDKQIFCIVSKNKPPSAAAAEFNKILKEEKCFNCFQPGKNLIILRFSSLTRCKEELLLAASMENNAYNCYSLESKCCSLIIAVHENDNDEAKLHSIYPILFEKLHKNKKLYIFSQQNYFSDNELVEAIDIN